MKAFFPKNKKTMVKQKRHYLEEKETRNNENKQEYIHNPQWSLSSSSFFFVFFLRFTETNPGNVCFCSRYKNRIPPSSLQFMSHRACLQRAVVVVHRYQAALVVEELEVKATGKSLDLEPLVGNFRFKLTIFFFLTKIFSRRDKKRKMAQNEKKKKSIKYPEKQYYY